MDWHKANEKYNALIKQLFHGDSWQERAEAAREIGLLKDGRATNLLCKCLQKEDNSIIRDKIIEALGRIGDAKATMIIVDKLKEEINKFNGNKFTVIYIIESFTRIKDKRALPYIEPFLSSPDEELRNYAEKAFDEMKPTWRDND